MKSIKTLPLYIACFALMLLVHTPFVFAQGLEINNVQIKNVGYTSATIAWFTNMPANSQVSYGKVSLDENTSPSSSTYTDNHSITVTNLKPATQYKFQVTSTNQEGITTASQELTFSTLSFTFDDSDAVGNFSSLNVSPTPIPQPYVQPNGQTTYPNTNPYVQGGTYPQPIYMIPPIIYQQPTTNGDTLGAQDTQLPAPTPIIIQSSQNDILQGLLQSSILGIIVLVVILVAVIGGGFYFFYKSRQDIDSLKQQIADTNRQSTNMSNNTNETKPGGQSNEVEVQDKTYSFEVT
jgi:hypothetical protein